MLVESQWALIFAAAKRRGARWSDISDVKAFKAEVLEAIAEPATCGAKVSERGIALMHEFEGCRLTAYPDPGSKDEKPVTIGWGSTSDMNGRPITLGTVWTQEQADERFCVDVNKFAEGVEAALGDAPTSQSQFDAMVSLAYNIGLGAFKRSTVLRKHKAGDFKGAAAAFAMWNRNDGRIMRGLTRRRLAESDLYDGD